MTFFNKKQQPQCIEIPKESVYIDKLFIMPYVNSLSHKLYFNNRATESQYIKKPTKHKHPIKNKVPRTKYDKKLKTITDNGIKCDMKIYKTRSEKYYAIFSYHAEPLECNFKYYDTTGNIVAGDGGSRDFYNFYDPHGRLITFKDDKLRIRTEHANIDKIRKKIKNVKLNNDRKSFNRLKYSVLCKYEKIENMVTDLHYKCISNLHWYYKRITIGDLNVGSIVKQKKLPQCVKREILALSHRKFQSRLIAKAETCGFMVRIADEYLTTQMCTRCLNLNRKVGPDSIYTCGKCGLVINRDTAGSRNIALKQIIRVDS